MSKFPDFYIAGAPRCGTTFLYSALKTHPKLFLCKRKEPRYFARDRTVFKGAVTDTGRYLGLFERARPDQLTGEASSAYLSSRVAMKLIHDVRPDAKIIVTLRDPIARMISLWELKTFQGTETRGLNETLRADLEESRRKRDAGEDSLTPYVDQSRYGEQLQRTLDIFSREQVHVMILEDTTADPLAALNRLTAFLGVDPFEVAPEADRNDLSAWERRQRKREPRPGSLLRVVRRLRRNAQGA